MLVQNARTKKTHLNLKNLFQHMIAPLTMSNKQDRWKSTMWLIVFNHQLKLRYTKLIGDGNPKTYASIVTADQYTGTKVKKLECIGQMEKRVRSNLRKLCNTHKG